MSDAEDFVAHVRDRRVVVVGGGLAGLIAAWECARVGVAVTVVEAADHLGGTDAPRTIDGVAVDGAHADFTPGDSALEAALSLLGQSETVPVPTPRIVIAGVGAAPRDGMLGIPANPWAPDVRRIIGGSGTWRAYLDRLRPPMTIGREPSLGALVRTRLGERVADLLVAPLAAARWEAASDDLDADAVLPGISAALTRTGSLTGAVGQLQADPPAERHAFAAGAGPLLTALDAHLGDLGADLRTAEAATAITPSGEEWHVHTTGGDLVADAVIVATGARAARSLLAPVLSDPDALGGVDEVDVLTLLLDAPREEKASPEPAEVCAFPVGSAVLSVTDAAALSPRIAASVGPHRRVLRVVLAASEREDAVVLAEAAASAAGLLGHPVAPAHVRGHTRVRRVAASRGRGVGDEDRIAAARAAIRANAGLYAVGGWLAGGDLADAIGDAIRTAEHVRHALLWGAESGAASCTSPAGCERVT